MPKLLDAHVAVRRRYAKLCERRRKLRTRPADERGPRRLHIAFQRRLLAKSGRDGGFALKVDAHDIPCRVGTDALFARRADRNPLWAAAKYNPQGARVPRRR